MHKILAIAILYTICLLLVLVPASLAQNETPVVMPTLTIQDKKAVFEEKMNMINQKISYDLSSKFIRLQGLEVRIEYILTSTNDASGSANRSAFNKLDKIKKDSDKLNGLISEQNNKIYTIGTSSATIKALAKKENDKLQKDLKKIRDNFSVIQNDLKSILKTLNSLKPESKEASSSGF